MIKVLVESPFKGNQRRNVTYARACLKDCFLRGEAPFASHLLYTQEGVLEDDIPEERTQGIEAGLLWGSLAEKTMVYIDLGLSSGMVYGIARAILEGRPVEFRGLKFWENKRNENFQETLETLGKAIKIFEEAP